MSSYFNFCSILAINLVPVQLSRVNKGNVLYFKQEFGCGIWMQYHIMQLSSLIVDNF
jgi:hypothetical protein